MRRAILEPLAAVKCITLFTILLGLAPLVSAPALAQTICNSQALISFPNGDNFNRIIGQGLEISITLTNGPSLDAGVGDSQTFATVHFFPACLSVAGGVCTVDQGATAGPPPPVEYEGSLTSNCPTVPSVDTSDPFDLKFNFSPPITLDNETSCSVFFNVRIKEPGDLGSTPEDILELASVEGVCGSGLGSSNSVSTEIGLTCPPCPDDGDVCTADTCDLTTFLCTHLPPPDCDDGNICTIDTCTGPNPGDCAHSTPPDCDDGDVCTVDFCTGPNPGDCANLTPPDTCDDGNICTSDVCCSPFECCHGTPPDCDDGNVCTVDACTGPNPGDCSHSTPPDCDDRNVCTIDTCTGPNPGDCVHSTPPNCDDGNVCTIDECISPTECRHSTYTCDDGNICTTDDCCLPFQCCHGPPPNCDDGNVCTIDACTGPNPGDCSHTTPPDCDDRNVCTIDTCTGPNPGDCFHSTPPNCDDADVCTIDECISPTECRHSDPCFDDNICTVDSCYPPDEGSGCRYSPPLNCDDGNVCTTDQCISPTECSHSTPPDCDDNNVCTMDACTGPYAEDCSHVPSPLSQTCGTSDACVDRGCDPTHGCFENDHSSECGASETCVDRGCDPATGCFERDPLPWPPECEEPQPGCRITAGGMTSDGGIDTAEFADISDAHFGGQVEAPCGCIGCFDDLDQVQGSWGTSRKARRGSFHALEFNSLICGCDGVFDGELCNPGDRELGPEPRPAGANMACFSGVGDFNPTTGRRSIRVAFRVEVEDRGEPGVGKAAPGDVYRMRIWIPTKEETAMELAEQVCCTHAAPTGRAPDIDDGGNLIHGNIQIHPPLPNTVQGTCPVPNGSCQQ